MKKELLIIVFVCVTSISWGQIHEVGIFMGGTNYIGDVGSTNYISPNKAGGGMVYKYNLNPRIALRGTISMLGIKGDDRKSSNEIRRNRNFSFSNTINELAIGIEYNFFEYDMTTVDKGYTPYILLEIAGIQYQSVSEETTTGNYNLKTKTGFSLPVGVGFKGQLAENIGFAIETRLNYTFQDDIDYTTKNIASLNFGGNSNDWYMFTGISLVYAFGRPACYAEEK